MRGRSTRGRVALLAACGLVCAGGVGSAQAQMEAGELDGFTPGHAAVQRAYEARFQNGVSAENIGRLSRGQSRRPHLVGTGNQQAVVESSLATLRRYGLDAHMQSYDVYVSRPEQIQVSMTKPDAAAVVGEGAAVPLAAGLRQRGRWLQRLLAARRRDEPVGVRELRPAGGLRGARPARRQRRRQDRDRALRRQLPRREGASRRAARRQGRDHLLRSGGRRLRQGHGVSGRTVAPGGLDPAREHPVHLGLPGGSPDAREAVGPGHQAARAGSGHGSREDPEHADLLRRGAAVVAGARRAGGARGVPGRPAVPLPRRARPDRGAPEPRHRLRARSGSATPSRSSAGPRIPTRRS